jgi:hypothetical protein
MGILLVYDVTDEKSFNSKSEGRGLFTCFPHDLYDSILSDNPFYVFQTSELGTLISSNMLLKALIRSSSATNATGRIDEL